MIRTLLTAIIGFVLLLNFAVSQTPQQQDSTTSMPKLEIPEITIVGKKAITLPFARKGEIYDVNIYQAPPPDSSLLGERLATAMPTGSMPRDEEKRVPLHASAEGAFGSFSSGKLRGYLDYEKGRWSFSGNTGFASTEGHVDNANASSFDLTANARTLLVTDNDVLRTLRFNAGTSLSTERYGLFAFSDIRRSRHIVSLATSLNSLDRRDISIDLGIGADFINLSDSYSSSEYSITAAEPELTSAVALNIGKVRWTTDLSFKNLALDYSYSTQSVTLFSMTSTARWKLSDTWSADAGIMFADGSDVGGSSMTLVLPTATVAWNATGEQSLRFWWKPTMQLTSYNDWTRFNPYLERELSLSPERKPVDIGIGYMYETSALTLGADISYSQFMEKGVIIGTTNQMVVPLVLSSNSTPALRLVYVEANQTLFEIHAQYKPSERIRLGLTGSIQPSFATGSSDQLPMTPLMKLNAKAELDLQKPVTLWASVDAWSSQNIDLTPLISTTTTLRSIDGAGLLNIGASTTIVPKALLSVSLRNILGTSYDWWAGYPAPGFQFSLEAKVNLK